ncbi:MAG: hypothetical protein M1818_002536 [Claussenomyces sp. TS43310]|nr:MAG: hypothetical protein M1818_002536 [Claussenomyces sp. TS43310]
MQAFRTARVLSSRVFRPYPSKTSLFYSTMKALVYKGVGDVKLEERPRPKLTATTDALVKVTKTTICGTDLHISKGDVATCSPGTILGHEGVGVIEEVGSAVRGFKQGQRVLISCISSCGVCDYCRKGMASHCETGGWILGNTIDGTQAEYVRIPHADASLYPIPDTADEGGLVMLSDALPTGFECGVLCGKVQPGSSVIVVGGGAVGLAALITAQLYSPSLLVMVDMDANRLKFATEFGATTTIDSSKVDLVETAMKLTDGKGFDACIEAVGIPQTFGDCQKLVAPGGTIANVGVHGTKVDLHLEKLWDKNISITTHLVDAVTTPMLLKLVLSGKLDPTTLVTHRFAFNDIGKAYDTFKAAAKNNALKVLIDM